MCGIGGCACSGNCCNCRTYKENKSKSTFNPTPVTTAAEEATTKKSSKIIMQQQRRQRRQQLKQQRLMSRQRMRQLEERRLKRMILRLPEIMRIIIHLTMEIPKTVETPEQVTAEAQMEAVQAIVET